MPVDIANQTSVEHPRRAFAFISNVVSLTKRSVLAAIGVAFLAGIIELLWVLHAQTLNGATAFTSLLLSVFTLIFPLIFGAIGLGFGLAFIFGFKPDFTNATRALSPARIAAWGLATLVVATVAAFIHEDVTYWFVTRFQPQKQAALALAAAQYGLLLASLLALFVSGRLLYPLMRVVDAKLARGLADKTRTRLYAGAFGLLALVGVGALMVRITLPFEGIERTSIAALILLGVVLVAAVSFAFLRQPAHPPTRRWRVTNIAVGLIALGVIFSGPTASRNSLALATLLNQGPIFRMVSPIYVQIGDPDKDQYASIMGGRDTAPFDPWAYPAAPEIPGNGIDDNCLLGDPPKGWRAEHDAGFVSLPENLKNKDFNILLITIDAVRWDHMSFNGYERDTTPRLQELAEKSVNFSRAYTQGTGTILSIPSYMSGRYICQMRCTNLHQEPDHRRPFPDIEFLPDYLRKKGYYTALFSATKYLSFFSDLDWDLYSNPRDKQAGRSDITSDEITDRTIKELETILPTYKTFAWLHYYDPHDSYVRHKKEKSYGSSKIDLYDTEVRFTDRHIGRLIDYWQKKSPLPTVIIVSADHGESLDEHGIPFHNMNFYDSITRVPLIIHIPGAKPQVVDEPVGLIDLVPSLRNLLDDAPEPDHFGRSLLGEIFYDRRDPEREIYQEAQFRQFRKYWSKRALTGKRYKFVWDLIVGGEELYDLDNDPHELNNIISEQSDIANAMRQRLYQRIEDITVTAPVVNNCNYRPPVGFTRYYPKPRDGLLAGIVFDQLPADQPANIEIDFGKAPNIRLVRYSVDPGQVQDSRRVTVRLWFENRAKVKSEHMIFVHLRGKRGGLKNLYENLDHWPAENLLPMRDWPVGKIIMDEFSFEIPSGMGAGEVDLYFGLWDPKRNKRLPVGKHPPKIKVKGDRIHLTTIKASKPSINAQRISPAPPENE